MKYIFLNPCSSGGLALKKWDKIKDHMSDLENCQVVDCFYDIKWNEFPIEKGDVFISAGGDGTLHTMVNALITNKGLGILNDIDIGHIGLGSNNSYLRPYSECVMLNGIPMKVSAETQLQDLIEIKIKDNANANDKTVYCVANASVGFLAQANLLFNTENDIGTLKKFNSDIADIYTFFKALSKWKAVHVMSAKKSFAITNMHFMKRPYYAAGLCFPEEISPHNGTFHFNLLRSRPGPEVMTRFLKMLFFKKWEEGRDETKELSHYAFKAEKKLAFEADGEIYFGKEFEIKICEQGIRLCK
jgi:diacylglycerol kinase family enzyme